MMPVKHLNSACHMANSLYTVVITAITMSKSQPATGYPYMCRTAGLGCLGTMGTPTGIHVTLKEPDQARPRT